MKEKMAEIERLMAPVLDGMQARHLHAVLLACLCETKDVLPEEERHTTRALSGSFRLQSANALAQ